MAYLEFMSGETKGRKIAIEKDELVLGRLTECDICVEDSAVSGKHCAVVRDGGKYSLRDLDSTNGTLLNGKRIVESRIKPKDIIMLGAAELLFDGDDVEVDESVPSTPPRRETAPTIVMSSSFADPNATSSGGHSSGFGAKRNTRGRWHVVALLIALALGALGYWFVKRLGLF